MATLDKVEILLGITGGIAAYKSAALCSQLVKHKASVSVVMTDNAQNFIAPLTFSTISGKPVYTGMFDSQQIFDTKHISLTDKADLIVVAPATANIIAKAANGICDDLLSSILCSCGGTVLMAPAMNTRMWNNPATQRNIETLKSMNYQFIGPDSGRLACGDTGSGRMSEPETILAKILEMSNTHLT